MTEFSILEHTKFLSGYLDAVARSATTGTDLFSLSVNYIKPESSSVTPQNLTQVENLNAEFGSLAENFLGVDQRSRLGFYLVDYICWLSDFKVGAKCYKDAVDPFEVTYHFVWQDGCRVTIVASKCLSTGA